MKIVAYHGKPAFYKGMLISMDYSINIVGFPKQIESTFINIFQGHVGYYDCFSRFDV